MKWFKHFSRAREDRNIEKLIAEYGIAGYGLYFYCLEVIVGSVEVDNVTFELEPDAELLARRLNMDTLLVEKIMHRCVELGLFELTDYGRIRCLKIGALLEKSMTGNGEMRAIIGKYKSKKEAEVMVNQEESGKVMTNPDKVMILPDQKRLEEKRRDIEQEEESQPSAAPSPRFKKPSLEEVREYCQERGNGINSEAFLDYYESRGWMVGKNPMRDWRAAVRTWEHKEWNRAPPKPFTEPPCPLCGGKVVDAVCHNPECPQYAEVRQ